MISNENLHFCAPNDNAAIGSLTNRIYFSKQITTIKLASLVSICLLLFVSSAYADSKSKRSNAKANARSHRVVENHRAGSKRNVASKRSAADKKRSTAKLADNKAKRNTRQRLYVRETAKLRENANNRVTVPNVRQTAIVNAKQPDNANASRPTLVNDIVIISEAREIPTASSLPPMTRGAGSVAAMPSIWPVAGAIRGGFGMRSNPFGGRGTEFHKGQDISAAYGSQVIATADGVVVISGWLRGYGQVVYVDHGNGISTRYGHLSRIDVAVGQTIKRGDQLGLVGSTGRSTGPHLHYEVRVDGQATNPIPYLPSIPLPPAPTTPVNR